MYEVLVNRLGGLSLPRKSVVRLADRPDMTLDVYRGRKETMQQQLLISQSKFSGISVVLRRTATLRYRVLTVLSQNYPENTKLILSLESHIGC